MPRIRFYNRRFASRAPVRQHPLWRLARRSPWENPPAFGFEILLGSRRYRRTVERDAGPPRGHPASNSHVLDGTVAGFGSTSLRPYLRSRAGRGSCRSFIGSGRLRQWEPSDASWGRPGTRAVLRPRCFQSLGSVQSLHVNARDFLELEAPSAGEDRCPDDLTVAVRRSAALAGRRGELPHVFIDVRKPRLDFLTPTAVAGASEAACASTTSAKKCFYEHDCGPHEHPGPPSWWSGRLPID